MAVLRLFASVRVAAGTGQTEIAGDTVSEVLSAACDRYGNEFARLVDNSRIWLNGDPVGGDDLIGDRDEIAILPPVSGGC